MFTNADKKYHVLHAYIKTIPLHAMSQTQKNFKNCGRKKTPVHHNSIKGVGLIIFYNKSKKKPHNSDHYY